MKTSILYFFSAAILASIVLSCADVQKPEQLAKIDQLVATIDSIELVVQANNLDSGIHYHNNSEAVERRIKQNYFTDTVDLNIARKMDRFKVMRRKIKPLTYDYNNLVKGCKEAKEKLALLKEDIENGHNERDRYDEFIKFEANKVYQLQVLCDGYHQDHTEMTNTYKELFGFLNKFSLDLAEKAKDNQQ